MFEKAASVTGMLSLAIGLTIGPTVLAQPVDTALIDTGSANDWLTYHGSYKSYHYSPLDQINTGNVRDLVGCVDSRAGALHPRTPIDAAGRRRRAVLHGFPQPNLCSRRCHRESDLVVYSRTRRGAGRPADPLALQSRRGDRRG